MRDLSLMDRIPFGKYKTRKVEEVLKEDPSYLVWLRQERKDKNEDTTFFSREVSVMLDTVIKGSAFLRRKYRPWDVELPLTPSTEPKPQEREPEAGYNGAWGMM